MQSDDCFTFLVIQRLAWKSFQNTVLVFHQDFQRIRKNMSPLWWPSLMLLSLMNHQHEVFLSKLTAETWMWLAFPVLYIRLATFTVSPQMSYCGLWAPITPATTGPKFKPEIKMNKHYNYSKFYFAVSNIQLTKTSCHQNHLFMTLHMPCTQHQISPSQSPFGWDYQNQ